MKIKGVVLRARAEFIKDHFGDDAWQRVLDALPAEDKKSMQNMLLAARWYPFEIGERIDKVIVDTLGNGKSHIFEEIGAKSAEQNLTMEHRTFLTPGKPQAFLKKAGIIYNFYYDTGYREYEETGPTSGVLTTYEAETHSVADCLTVIGWYREALKMCGATDVRIVEEECRAKGGSYCRYRVEWKI